MGSDGATAAAAAAAAGEDVAVSVFAFLPPVCSRLAVHSAQYHLAPASATTLLSISGSWHRWCQAASHPSQNTIWLLSFQASRVQHLHMACSANHKPKRKHKQPTKADGLYVVGLVTWR